MIKLFYPLFMAFWRDSFGKNGYHLPVYENRFIEHCLAFVMTCLVCWLKDLPLICCMWIAFWIQIEWAIGHGPCYDCGTGGKPDAKMLKRYEKMVGYKLLCKIFPENQWYSFGFDFILLAIRYTYPLLPICLFFNPVFLTIGIVISALYGMYRYCGFFRTHRLLDVEIWAGFFLGLYVACL